MFVGIMLLLMGILMLLDKMGFIYGSVWDYFVPIAIIAVGISFIFNSKKQNRHKE